MAMVGRAAAPERVEVLVAVREAEGLAEVVAAAVGVGAVAVRDCRWLVFVGRSTV